MYPNYDEDCYQPSGIDLRLGDLYEKVAPDGKVGLFGDKKKLPDHKRVSLSKGVGDDGKTYDGFWLQPNTVYSVRVDGKMSIPNTVVQQYFARSTIMRLGLILTTALGDNGYNGVLEFLITNNCDYSIFLTKGVRFCQMVSHESTGHGQYDGQYQEKGD